MNAKPVSFSPNRAVYHGHLSDVRYHTCQYHRHHHHHPRIQTKRLIPRLQHRQHQPKAPPTNKAGPAKPTPSPKRSRRPCRSHSPVTTPAYGSTRAARAGAARIWAIRAVHHPRRWVNPLPFSFLMCHTRHDGCILMVLQKKAHGCHFGWGSAILAIRRVGIGLMTRLGIRGRGR